jgi:hypothetical protein
LLSQIGCCASLPLTSPTKRCAQQIFRDDCCNTLRTIETTFNTNAAAVTSRREHGGQSCRCLRPYVRPLTIEFGRIICSSTARAERWRNKVALVAVAYVHICGRCHIEQVEAVFDRGGAGAQHSRRQGCGNNSLHALSFPAYVRNSLKLRTPS